MSFTDKRVVYFVGKVKGAKILFYQNKIGQKKVIIADV